MGRKSGKIHTRIQTATHHHDGAITSTSERFEHYRQFKQTLEYEGYLALRRPKIYQDTIVRLRLGIDNRFCNKYRYNTSVQMRLCPLGEVAEENEIHLIFACQALNQLRKVYIDPLTVCVINTWVPFVVL